MQSKAISVTNAISWKVSLWDLMTALGLPNGRDVLAITPSTPGHFLP